MLGQRYGSPRRHGGAQAQRHGVHTGQRASVLREVALDDTRQQHADNANARPSHQAAEEHANGAECASHPDTERQRDKNAEDHPLTAKTPRQQGCQRGEQPQAQHRQGSQQAGLRGTQTQPFRHQPQHRRHARQRRAQVQGHQHQAQQQQPGPP